MSGKDKRERLAAGLERSTLFAESKGRPVEISQDYAHEIVAALREREPKEEGVVERARAYALQAHGDQRYGPMPWAWHFDHVAELASRHGERAQVLAYLHDVIEDTPVNFDDLCGEFGVDVAAEVDLLSDTPGTRKERHAGMCARMRTAPAHVVTVKACDRLVNVRACYEFAPDLLSMYRKERETFRAATEHAAPAWMLDQIDALLAEPQPEREPDGWEILGRITEADGAVKVFRSINGAWHMRVGDTRVTGDGSTPDEAIVGLAVAASIRWPNHEAHILGTPPQDPE